MSWWGLKIKGGTTVKKIFIITCNPKEHSSKEDYVNAYIDEAKKAGHEIKTVNLYDLNIDYLRLNEKDSLSGDLKQAQDDILWADQLIFVYSIWWFSIPAILKAFIDKTFEADVVSKMGKMGPEPLLKNKTAVIIQSYDMPYFCMKYLWGDLPMKWWKLVLEKWCGPKIVKRFDFDLISNVPEKRKQKWIKNIRKFVEKL